MRDFILSLLGLSVAIIINTYALYELLEWKHDKPYFTYLYLSFYYSFSPPLYLWACHFFSAFCFMYPLMPKRKIETTKYGYARKATSKDIKKMGLFSDKGMPLGRWKGIELKYNTPYSTLCLAPTGAGKTSTLLMPIILSSENSLIIHDCKGELVKFSGKYRAEKGEVYIIDLTSPNSDKFNVLDSEFVLNDEKTAVHLGRARVLLSNVANKLLTDEKDSYWIKAARRLFVFAGLYLYWKDGNASIPEILDLLSCKSDFTELIEDISQGIDPRTGEVVVEMTTSEKQSAIRQELDIHLKTPPELRNKRTQETIELLEKELKNGEKIDQMPAQIKADSNRVMVMAKSPEQQSGVVDSTTAALELFTDENVRKATTGKCCVNEKILRDGLCTVYLVVKDEDKDRISTVVSLIITTLCNQLTSRVPNKEKEQRVTLCLDEFCRLGKNKTLAQLPEISRGYNVNSILIAQDYNQIDDIYGHNVRKTFETNCPYKIIYHQNSQDTAEGISRLIGNYTEESKSVTKNERGGESERQGEVGIPLYSAQDIKALEREKLLILAEFYYHVPIEADTNYWEEHEPYKSIKEKYSFSEYEQLEKVYSQIKKGEIDEEFEIPEPDSDLNSL